MDKQWQALNRTHIYSRLSPVSFEARSGQVLRFSIRVKGLKSHGSLCYICRTSSEEQQISFIQIS